MKKAQILLSTYNGSQYVAQQIESLLNQSYSNIRIYIRDDGSTDNTVEILTQYAILHPDRIKVIKGSNVGVIKSFLTLLQTSDEEAAYYCFCDQDDVWLPNKVERAVNQINTISSNSPIMIFTATQMTNSALEPLKVWPKKPSREPSFYNALIQNIAVGATVTINKEARELLNAKEVQSDKILMHDWWAYLCISAFGKTYFDDFPSILYRQHANNVVGGEVFLRDIIRKKWNSFRKHNGNRLLYKQALEFNRLYGAALDAEKKQQLLLFLSERSNILQRISYLFQSKLYRQSLTEQLLFRFLILIGYI